MQRKHKKLIDLSKINIKFMIKIVFNLISIVISIHKIWHARENFIRSNDFWDHMMNSMNATKVIQYFI